MSVHATRDDRSLRISIRGRFDFKCHNDFRSGYWPAVEEVDRIVIDLSGTEYMDSSALGMLLVLRKEASKSGCAVELTGASETVSRILEIANFQSFFKIAS